MVSVRKAIRRAQTDWDSPQRFGMCKKRSRELYDIPSDGTADAINAWRHAEFKFLRSWVPGAFAFWRGGSQGHGHVAICSWRKGYVWSVDILNPGHWTRVKLTDIQRIWDSAGTLHDLHFVGFSRDIDGKIAVSATWFATHRIRWYKVGDIT